MEAKVEAVEKLLGITAEQKKYRKVWGVDAYRNVSPGERCVPMFLEALGQTFSEEDIKKMTLVDIGAGTGRGGHGIWKATGMDVTLMDFAPNCLDEEVRKDLGDKFIHHDITEKSAERYDLGYCCDVMEHLPEEEIDTALTNIFEMCTNVFFQIATVPDVFGQHPDIDEDLHLTVWQYHKWLKKFAEFGVTVHRSYEARHHVVFFVSGYCGFAMDKMRMNTSPEVVWNNIRENLSLGLKQVQLFEEQPDQKVILLAGGPSLNEHVDEIKEHKKNGAKIVTVNNTYNWARENDLWPVNQVMIDCRPFNQRFIEPVSDENTYFMCSQVDPEIVKLLPEEKTWIFQGNLDQQSIDLMNDILGPMYEKWLPIPGGSTVVLRTLPLLGALGFRDIEVYGFDSCFGGKPVERVKGVPAMDLSNHHAYEQKENDIKSEDDVTVIKVAGKSFAVNAWMLCQVMEYCSYGMNKMLSGMDIKIHGDGLIAHCVKEGLSVLDPLDVKEDD